MISSFVLINSENLSSSHLEHSQFTSHICFSYLDLVEINSINNLALVSAFLVGFCANSRHI